MANTRTTRSTNGSGASQKQKAKRHAEGAKRKADGTICSTAAIGQARKAGGEFRFKPKFFDYDSFWLNSPGTYYWQAHRIECVNGTEDCRQEGPIVKFRVG